MGLTHHSHNAGPSVFGRFLLPRPYESFGGRVGGHVQAGLAVARLLVVVDTGLQQHPHRVGVALLGAPAGAVQGGEAVRVPGLGASLSCESYDVLCVLMDWC